jgi:50S ribosomal subunit-associated GTPase HflX
MAAGEPPMGEKKLVKTMIGVEVLEMTASGLQLITTVESNKSNEEDIYATLQKFTEMVYEHDKMYLITETVGFAIRGLETKTIVFRGVFEDREPKEEESCS